MKLYAEQVSQLLTTEKSLRLQLTADGEKFQQFQVNFVLCYLSNLNIFKDFFHQTMVMTCIKLIFFSFGTVGQIMYLTHFTCWEAAPYTIHLMCGPDNHFSLSQLFGDLIRNRFWSLTFSLLGEGYQQIKNMSKWTFINFFSQLNCSTLI